MLYDIYFALNAFYILKRHVKIQFMNSEWGVKQLTYSLPSFTSALWFY